MQSTGTVKWFNSTKGYGFISQDDNSDDLFVHVSVVEKAGLRDLKEGQKIRFEKGISKKTGKEAVIELEII